MELVFSASFFRDWDAYRCPLQFRKSRFTVQDEKIGAAFDNSEAEETAAAAPPVRQRKRVTPLCQSNCSRGIEFEANCFEALATKLSSDLSFVQNFTNCSEALLLREANWSELINRVQRECNRRASNNIWKEAVWFVTELVWLKDDLKECGHKFFETVCQNYPHVKLSLGTMKPDVLELRFLPDKATMTYQVQFRVGDLKSALSVHRYHRLQIATYHMVVAFHLKDFAKNNNNTSRFFVGNTGEVWLDENFRSASTTANHATVFFISEAIKLSIQTFDIQTSIDQVRDFFERGVSLMSKNDVEDVPWLIRSSCQSCPHLWTCQQRSLQYEPITGISCHAVVVADQEENILHDVPTSAPVKIIGQAVDSVATANKEPVLSPFTVLAETSIDGSAQLVAPLTQRDIVLCHLQEFPTFYFTATVGHCKVSTTDRNEALEWLHDNVQAPSFEFPSVVTIVFSNRERNLLFNLVRDNPALLAKFFVNFDTLLCDSKAQQRSSERVLEEVKSLSLRFLKGTQFVFPLRETSLAHMQFSTKAFGDDFALLLFPQLVRALIGTIDVCDALNPLSPQEADHETMQAALALFLPCATKLHTIVTENKTFRKIPPVALDIKVEATATAADSSSPVEKLSAAESCAWHQVLAAASECSSMWLNRVSDTSRPFLVKIVEPLERPSADNTEAQKMKSATSFRAEVIPNQEWPTELSRTIHVKLEVDEPADAASRLHRNVSSFSNGNYFTIPIPKRNLCNAVLDEIDRLEDWLYFAKRTRSFQNVFVEKNTIVKSRPNVRLVDVSEPISQDAQARIQFVLRPLLFSPFKTDMHLLLIPTYHDFNFANLWEGLCDIKPASLSPLTSLIQGSDESLDCASHCQKWISINNDATISTECNSAQQDFLTNLGTRRLSILWGPPGTGKTATLARMLSTIRRKAEVGTQTSSTKLVLVIASTNTALETLYDALIERDSGDDGATVVAFSHSSKPKIDKSFWTSFDVGSAPRKSKRLKIVNSLKPAPENPDQKDSQHLDTTGVFSYNAVIVFATVWQLKNIPNRVQFDMLVVDEATQITVPQTLLADRLMQPYVQVVVAGDPLQLSPILPSCIENSMAIHNCFGNTGEEIMFTGSFFESVLFQHRSHGARTRWRLNRDPISMLSPNCVMLTTSYRSVPDIVHCVGKLYDNALHSAATLQSSTSERSSIVVHYVSPQQVSHTLEASALVSLIQSKSLVSEFSSIGIVTPHRRQRTAVEKALRDASIQATVDTAERMQGQQFDVVIFTLASLAATSFVLNLRRVNVATSRAKFQLHIVLHGNFASQAESVVQLDDTGDSLRAWNHLQHFLVKKS